MVAVWAESSCAHARLALRRQKVWRSYLFVLQESGRGVEILLQAGRELEVVCSQHREGMQQLQCCVVVVYFGP